MKEPPAHGVLTSNTFYIQSGAKTLSSKENRIVKIQIKKLDLSLFSYNSRPCDVCICIHIHICILGVLSSFNNNLSSKSCQGICCLYQAACIKGPRQAIGLALFIIRAVGLVKRTLTPLIRHCDTVFSAASKCPSLVHCGRFATTSASVNLSSNKGKE